MIKELSQQYPVQLLSELLGLPRSSYYYQAHEKADDRCLLSAIEKVIMHKPYYGYRRVTQQLKRNGHDIGETRVRRLLKALEHRCNVGKVHFSTTNSRHNLRRYPNRIKHLQINMSQVWGGNLNLHPLDAGSSTRPDPGCLPALSAVGIISRSLDKTLSITCTEKALAAYPAPEVHHSDQVRNTHT